MYMGATIEDESLDNSIIFLANQGVSKTDIYFDYYATQVFRHYGGQEWKEWNVVMREHLIDTQDRSNGHTRVVVGISRTSMAKSADDSTQLPWP